MLGPTISPPCINTRAGVLANQEGRRKSSCMRSVSRLSPTHSCAFFDSIPIKSPLVEMRSLRQSPTAPSDWIRLQRSWLTGPYGSNYLVRGGLFSSLVYSFCSEGAAVSRWGIKTHSPRPPQRVHSRFLTSLGTSSSFSAKELRMYSILPIAS